MTFLTIIIAIIAAALIYYVISKGDQDGDGDIDIKDIKISTEDLVEDLTSKAADVLEEVSDVASAIQGKPTKAKLNKLTKQQLVDAALADHGKDLDIKVKKSVLVNKVYSLYH